MKPNIKIIFVDVDDTLFDHGSNTFTLSAIESLNTARRKGIKVIIASSRPYFSLDFLGAIKTIPHDGYICTNGGIIFAEGQYIKKGFIPNKVVEYVERVCDEHNILLHIVTLKDMFANRGENEHAVRFRDRWIQPIPRIKKYEGEEVSSLIIFGKEEVEPYFNKIPNVYFFKFFDGGYDIYEYEYTKDVGIKEILAFYDFSKDEAIAIGDDIYDIPMLKEVKYSVCMGNGKEEVKATASYVTENIENDGLKKALKHFNVI